MARVQSYPVSTDPADALLLGVDKENKTKLFTVLTLLRNAGYATPQEVRDTINQLVADNQIITPTSLDQRLTGAINALLGGAGPAYDTLKELQDLIINDESALSGALTQIGNLTTTLNSVKTDVTDVKTRLTAVEGGLDPIVAAIVFRR